MPDELMKSWCHLRDMLMVENERVKVEWMHSLLKIDLNRFLGYKNQKFKSWNTFSKNEQLASTFTLSFSTPLA